MGRRLKSVNYKNLIKKYKQIDWIEANPLYISIKNIQRQIPFEDTTLYEQTSIVFNFITFKVLVKKLYYEYQYWQWQRRLQRFRKSSILSWL